MELIIYHETQHHYSHARLVRKELLRHNVDGLVQVHLLPVGAHNGLVVRHCNIDRIMQGSQHVLCKAEQIRVHGVISSGKNWLSSTRSRKEGMDHSTLSSAKRRSLA